MNKHQEIALKLIKREFNDIVGGLENTLDDYGKDEQEYKEAFEMLTDIQTLSNTIYDEVTFRATQMGWAKEIRFAGKDWIMTQIHCRILEDKIYLGREIGSVKLCEYLTTTK